MAFSAVFSENSPKEETNHQERLPTNRVAALMLRELKADGLCN